MVLVKVFVSNPSSNTNSVISSVIDIDVVKVNCLMSASVNVRMADLALSSYVKLIPGHCAEVAENSNT